MWIEKDSKQERLRQKEGGGDRVAGIGAQGTAVSVERCNFEFLVLSVKLLNWLFGLTAVASTLRRRCLGLVHDRSRCSI